MNDTVEQIIDERAATHGAYEVTAMVSQRLKLCVRAAIISRNNSGQQPLNAKQVESLEMIMSKVSRIISGDPYHKEHWDDIAGYAKIAVS